MKSYFCKYIPPRSDFLSTMTEEETSLMQQHGAFLDQRLAEGLILAHGPVIDDTGGFGLSLYQIADDQQIADFTAQDPMIQNGIGHYAHYPMLHLKVRG
ncbi:YciI family protein [Xanthomonas hortorum]|uniref:YCII-related domain-containing protein n=1 Tax=Xanthomonas hortorum pv. gardneri TaxID=2754056 RepID=A0A6V7B8B5_9XANT|nr:YciI family protein [Xanthomonas hortorum]MCC4625608.1 YciI family protein [Xanthomonas campestris pv. nigromaculans]APP78671.1 hypothetical protein BJD10_02195 [Xanthomonas hortorum pv. gardneri]EGD17617.1 YCII-related domain-containing protein [Xanthomonas hortorum ATCC 19865]KLA94784.1 hypothetical protein SM17710_19030 [Xanthomonas hortorum pv. gardneri]KLA97305.1 hypothetical protein SM19410_10745 [Xanthomonas hortorum pv. gardneri]